MPFGKLACVIEKKGRLRSLKIIRVGGGGTCTPCSSLPVPTAGVITRSLHPKVNNASIFGLIF